MDEAKKRKAKRRRNALARLGTVKPSCSICGEGNPLCLELHEPGGRRYNEMRVAICRNCHRKLSDDQRDHPKAEFTPPDKVERLAHSLLGEADLLSRLSEKRRQDAEMLLAYVRKDAIPPEDGPHESGDNIG